LFGVSPSVSRVGFATNAAGERRRRRRSGAGSVARREAGRWSIFRIMASEYNDEIMKYIRNIVIGVIMSLAITMVSKHMGGATLLMGYLIGMVIGVIATISQNQIKKQRSQSSRI